MSTLFQVTLRFRRMNPNIAAPGRQLTFQGGNAWQEVTVRGNGTAAFGGGAGTASKTSRIRTAVAREGVERLNGPEIEIVILNNANPPRIVFMPITARAAPRPVPTCVQVSNGSRGLGFRVVATQQPAAPGVTLALAAGAVVPAGIVGPGAVAGACQPAAVTLNAANYNHGAVVLPPEGGAQQGTFVVNYFVDVNPVTNPANPLFATGGFVPALNVRNGAGGCPAATPQTVTPWIAGGAPSAPSVERLAGNGLGGSRLVSALLSPALFLAAPDRAQAPASAAASSKDRRQGPRLLGFVPLPTRGSSPNARPATPRLLGFVPLLEKGPPPITKPITHRLLGFVPLPDNRSRPTTQRVRPRLLGFVSWSKPIDSIRSWPRCPTWSA